MIQKQNIFQRHGNTCSFDYGYIPTFIFIKATHTNGTIYYFWSENSLNNVYTAYKGSGVASSSAFSVDDTKITLTTSLSSWHNATINIYAIK